MYFSNEENTKKNSNEITTYAGNLFENVDNCKLGKERIGRS
jgi:hypothetical protein